MQKSAGVPNGWSFVGSFELNRYNLKWKFQVGRRQGAARGTKRLPYLPFRARSGVPWQLRLRGVSHADDERGPARDAPVSLLPASWCLAASF